MQALLAYGADILPRPAERRCAIISENEKYKYRAISILVQHKGEENAIDMGELYCLVFGKPYQNKINDTRAIRTIITEMRKEGQPIGSNGDGYYLIKTKSELDKYCSRLRKRAIRIFSQEAHIRKISLPELVGQVHLLISNEIGAPDA